MSLPAARAEDRGDRYALRFTVYLAASVSVRQTPQVVTPQVTTQVTTQVATEVATEVCPEIRLAGVVIGEMMRQVLGLKNDEHFRKTYLSPALEAGLIEMTIPDKPRSTKQRDRLTAKGKRVGKPETS